MNNRTCVVAISANEPTPLCMPITEYIKTLTHDIYKTQVLIIGTEGGCRELMDDPVSVHGEPGATYVSKDLFDRLIRENIMGKFWTVDGTQYKGVNFMGYRPIVRDKMTSLEECLYFLLEDQSEVTRVIEPEPGDEGYTISMVRPDLDRAIEATLRFVLTDRDDPEVLGQASKLLETLTDSIFKKENHIFLGRDDFRTLYSVVKVTGDIQLTDRMETLFSQLLYYDIEDPLLY